MNAISTCAEEVGPTETINDSVKWDYELVKTKWYKAKCLRYGEISFSIHYDLRVDVYKSTFGMDINVDVTHAPAIAINKLELIQ